MPEARKGWENACRRLRAELGEAKFSSWFGRVEIDRLNGQAIHLTVPTKFLKQWIQQHFAEKVRAALITEMPSLVDVVIEVRSSARIAERESGASAQPVAALAPTHKKAQAAAMEEAGERAVLAGSPLDRRLTFETFLVGVSNQMAHAASRRIAEAPSGEPLLFNPLYLHSAVGLGKTHLAQAVAQAAAANGRRVVYLTAEKFMYGFVTALKSQNAIAFKDALRAIDVLIIDDIQFLNGKVIQQEFCHVLNSLLDSGKQVVVAADRPPVELESLDERVKSRLAGGLSVEIGSFDEELRYAILCARIARHSGVQAPEPVLRYVARVIDTNGRDLEGAVNRLVGRVMLTGASVTLEAAEKAISDLVRMREPKKVKIDDIQKLVAGHYNVSRADLLSSRRTASVVRPRQIAMYLAKTLTLRSLPEIGRRFGGRDHTTVLHAVRKIEGMVNADTALAQDLELLKRMLTEI
ncbi:MAG: chromosomal replication initiator protein DnaA [Hyphomicrobiales bacterium]|nr:chromosomal replication initiator protein DnaA [Hyphomicrobiales bacterium]